MELSLSNNNSLFCPKMVKYFVLLITSKMICCGVVWISSERKKMFTPKNDIILMF